MFYSKSTGGFYDTAINGDNIPPDAIKISSDEHAALLTGQSAGKQIVADATGRPVLKDPPPASAAQLWGTYQAQAQELLDKSDTTIIRCAESGVPVPAEWAAYRKSLRAIIGASTGDPSKPLPTRPAYPAGT